MEQKKVYDVVLLGATFYSVGYSASSDKACLIIDSRSVVGSEFAAALKANATRLRDYSPNTNEFREKLLSKDLLKENGKIHVTATSLDLAEYMYNHELDVLLETQIIAVSKDDIGYSVSIFNRDGYSTVKARTVIDTRTVDAEGSYKTLGLVLAGGSRFPKVPSEIGFVQAERNENEPIFHMYVKAEDTIITAKEKMRDIIEKSDFFEGWHACSIAPSFATHYPNGVVSLVLQDGVKRIVSASFDDILSAMERGECDAASDVV